MKSISPMRGCKNYRSIVDRFHLCECGSGAAPKRFGLNFKYAHEKLGSTQGYKVLANKAHVNTWVIMCKLK